MKNRFLKTALLFCSFIFLFGSVNATEKDEKSLLWKITGNGLTSPSYLFGTIHIICKDKFVMDSRIEQALAESKQLALEIDMSDPEMNTKMQNLSLNPGMRNVSEDLTAEEAKAINDFMMANYGAGLDQMGILKPFVLSSLVLSKSITCKEQVQYESYFVEQVKTAQKKIFALETIESQIAIFDNIPQKLQIHELAKAIIENKNIEEFAKMMNYYNMEDVEKIYNMSMEDVMFQEYADLLLYKRNEAWIPKIEELIKSNSTFVAVGSAHLLAERGVINLLRKAGYTVEAVINN